MSCDAIRKQLSLVMYGELTFDEEENVHQHLESCPDCQVEFEKVKSLHRCLSITEPQVPQDLLVNSRRNLRVTVAALQESGLVRPQVRFGWLKSWWSGSWQLSAAWKPAAALGLLAIGFLGGQYSTRQSLPAFLGGAPDPAFSRVRFVQPDDSGNVRLVVEEVRQRTMSGDLDDSRIRSLLVSAARESADPGVRVETLGLLKAHSESAEVKRALLAALQSDTNPGVRLKALEALRASADDNDTRRVLAQVLLTDENPGVRTQAIDLLTQRRERSMVGVLQEVMAREDNNYVRLKCQKALADMNASVETF